MFSSRYTRRALDDKIPGTKDNEKGQHPSEAKSDTRHRLDTNCPTFPLLRMAHGYTAFLQGTC